MTDLRVVVTFVQITWCQMVCKMRAPIPEHLCKISDHQNVIAKSLTPSMN